MNAAEQAVLQSAPKPAEAHAHRVEVAPHDPDVRLLIPAVDTDAPVLSLVVPALNEEVTIGKFIAWCKEGIAKLGVPTEIVIVDSSSDRTPEIALAAGARVVRTPRRGLGRAYIDALGFVRGKYLILGDVDCTYDFRELGAFYEQFERGDEFIMGSRFRGSIEDGAMPPLHQYFGTPFTTWILNLMYGTQFTDIHCGMRGITLEAFTRMQLASQSWEYASEMVLKSVHMRLKTGEVPVNFYKDQAGRTSHHVREGWFSPWKAGWINLRAMFVFGADFFLFWPGLILALGGSVGVLALTFGPIASGGVTYSLNTMLMGAVLGAVGLQMLLTALVSRALYDGHGARRAGTRKLLPYTETTLACVALFFAGLITVLNFVAGFVGAGMQMTQVSVGANHSAVTGLYLMIVAVLTFTNMLVLHAVELYVPIAKPRPKT